jgi:hypothetical protein
MKHLVGYEVYQDDALVIRWKRSKMRTSWTDAYTYSQGKRLSKAILDKYPWAREMAREYVRDGSVAAVKFIRKEKGCGLQMAFDILCEIRRKR